MEQITRGEIVRVGIDLAKHVIQVHAVDSAGRVVAEGDVVAQTEFVLHTMGTALQILLGFVGTLTLAIGGIRIQVPENEAADAKEFLASDAP